MNYFPWNYSQPISRGLYAYWTFINRRPKNKYIRITKDEHFRVDEHYLSNVGIQAEKCCAYDLEDVDVVWLNILNGERALLGKSPVKYWSWSWNSSIPYSYFFFHPSSRIIINFPRSARKNHRRIGNALLGKSACHC